VNVTIAHRGDVIPARTCRDALPAHRLAAPRADDHVWSGVDHLIARDDAIGREFRPPQLRKHGIATGNLDQFFDPLDTGDQRVIPFLEIHARPAREGPGALANLIEASFQLAGQSEPLFRRADDAAENADHLQDLADASLVEREHRIPALHQLTGDLRLQVGERQDQIGIERRDLLVAGVQE
jgi:hypothetical protein